MNLVLRVDNAGTHFLHHDEVARLLAPLGRVTTRRASHVEPEPLPGEVRGAAPGWSADLSPVGGPLLPGFSTRQAALDAERDWITQNVLQRPCAPTPTPPPPIHPAP
jgi:hypothetical protein